MSSLPSLPQASVLKVIRKYLPDNVSMSKDARESVVLAANIFIHYLSAAAADITKENKRSTITAESVLMALQSLGFDDYVIPLQESLENMRKKKKEIQTHIESVQNIKDLDETKGLSELSLEESSKVDSEINNEESDIDIDNENE